MSNLLLPDVVDEAQRLASAAGEAGVPVRVLGGVAVSMHAPGGIPEGLARPYRDIDVVTTSKGRRDTQRLLTSIGYEPNERFNAMNGAHRMVFYDLANERQLDVFVGEFRMCHKLPIADRLQLEPATVPLAELVLTKLQIVSLNEKDLRDIYAIVLEHEVAEHDEDTINAAYVASLLAGDWGLWRTSKGTLETARARLPDYDLDVSQRTILDDRLSRLWIRIDEEPKSLRWRSRARVGERTKWYEEPEEIAHGVG